MDTSLRKTGTREKHGGKEKEKGATINAAKREDTLLYRLPALDRERYLADNIFMEDAPPLPDDSLEELTGEEGEEPGGEGSDDDGQDGFEEGELSERDEPPSYFEDFSDKEPLNYKIRPDIIVEILQGEGEPVPIVRSGNSEQLLKGTRGDRKSSWLQNAIRSRILQAHSVVQFIVSRNRDFFLGRSREIVPIDSSEIMRMIPACKNASELSRLRNSITIKTPFQEEFYRINDFMERRKARTADMKIIKAILECWDDERKSPLKDKELEQLTKIAIDKNEIDKDGRRKPSSTIRMARSALGIPKPRQRRQDYEAGKSFIMSLLEERARKEMKTKAGKKDMTARGERKYQKTTTTTLKTIGKYLSDEQGSFDEETRAIALGWIEEINAHLKGGWQIE